MFIKRCKMTDLFATEKLSAYSPEFLSIYKRIQDVSAFKHKLYHKDGTPTKLLLDCEIMIQSLLRGVFHVEYRITNRIDINNVEQLRNIKDVDIIEACSLYPKGIPCPLDEYFRNRNRYSRLVADILNPGYTQAKDKAFKRAEQATHDVLCTIRKEYAYVIAIYRDDTATAKKTVALYEWWKPHSDAIWRFADSCPAYQKTFMCLLDHWFEYTKDIPKIGYNAFGVCGGKMWKNFIDFCVKKGYYLEYSKDSWVLPWNRRTE
jgi:hypothetical protein